MDSLTAEHQPSSTAQRPPPLLPPKQLTPNARILCEILANTAPGHLETHLSYTRIQPGPELVQEILKASYGSPSAAIQFFKWAGLARKHTEENWNLMVDLLGKNKLFEAMWDAIRSMKQEGVLSVATFVLVFDSYCVAGKCSEAIMSFDLMEGYGVQLNIYAVNSLLSAICREDNQTATALEFFERIKVKIGLDVESFAILLEALEKDGNVAKAKNIFGEMVIRIGWAPQYMSVYDSFLTTLVRGSQVDEAIKFFQVMKGKKCLPGLKFFSSALDILVKKNDCTNAVLLWDTMVGSGLIPNLIMYNAMIGLLCNNNDIDNAFRLLDEMVFHGAFPDSSTYNMIFKSLVKNKKVREARSFFVEMTKNEFPPTYLNCAAAISLFFDKDDPESATEIWEYMFNNDISPLADSANALLVGLCKLGRLMELRRFADNMLNRRIEIYESTMMKLKDAYYKEGKTTRDVYDHLARKWKSSESLS